MKNSVLGETSLRVDDIWSGVVWQNLLDDLKLESLSDLSIGSTPHSMTGASIPQLAKASIDLHYEWKTKQSTLLSSSIREFCQYMTSLPSASVDIAKQLLLIEKAADSELELSENYPEDILETAEIIASFTHQERERIEMRLERTEELRKKAKFMKECAGVNVKEEVDNLSKLKKQLAKERRIISKLKFDLTHLEEAEEDEDEEEEVSKEELSKQLERARQQYATLNRTYEETLSNIVNLGCQHFPEIFSLYKIKPFASIDSEIQIEHFHNYKPLDRESNHAIFYGELGKEKYLLKQYPHTSAMMKNLFDKEVAILRSFNHPRIISLKYVLHEKNSNCAFLVFPFYPHNLTEWIEAKKPNDLLLQNVWRGICHGLEHLCHVGVIHRDIKPSNILITEDDEPILSDFDISTTSKKGTAAYTLFSAGTKGFMAPEVEEGIRATSASDMYSFGRLLEETKSSHSPNASLDALIQKLLSKDPKDRPSASQVLMDHYFTKSLLIDQIETLKRSEEIAQQQLTLQQREIELEKEKSKISKDLERVKKQKKTMKKMKRETKEEREKYEAEKAKLGKEEERVKNEWSKIKEEAKKNRKMEKILNKKERELLNPSQLASATALPHYWKLSRVSLGAIPVSVDVTSEMLNEFQALINDTCDKSTLGKGRDMTAPQQPYSQLKVVKITRWENPALWYQYSLKKAVIASQHAPLTESLTVKSWLPWMADSLGLVSALNEVFLFHGTKPENFPTIQQQGFDERVGSLGGLYGAGIYFDQYVTPDASGSFFMFLSRVTLGSPFHTAKKYKKQRRPPQRSDKNCLFDSLVGEKSSKKREFIVYDKTQCYPEFLIEYKRI